jgi:hypothetical protein
MNFIGSCLPKAEIVHYYQDGDMVFTQFNTVYAHLNQTQYTFKLPLPFIKRMIGKIRLGRRAARLDKSNLVPAQDRSCLLAVYQGRLYRYDLKTRLLQQTGQLNQGRNALHQSILSTGQHSFYLGEYSANTKRLPVKIWGSTDGARSWQVAYEFPAHSIKHVHGIYQDPHTQQIWVTTGDFAGECYLYIFDAHMHFLRRLGDGSQIWRTVSLFFRADAIYWITDSQLETNYLVRLDKSNDSISHGQTFPGPVWYIKDLQDGIALAATAYETGPGVKTKCVHLLMSTDLNNWVLLQQFHHDGWPLKYFKFGVINFADGNQYSDDFVLSGEALRKLDGKSLICALESNLNSSNDPSSQILSAYRDCINNCSQTKYELNRYELPVPRHIKQFNDMVFIELCARLLNADQQTENFQQWLDLIRNFLELYQRDLTRHILEKFNLSSHLKAERLKTMMLATMALSAYKTNALRFLNATSNTLTHTQNRTFASETTQFLFNYSDQIHQKMLNFHFKPSTHEAANEPPRDTIIT